jgi:hypothetical protein
MAKQPVKDVFERNRYDLATAAKRSRSWFDQQVRMLAGENLTPQKLLATNPDKLENRIQAGHLYMFMYDPKTKDKLPYYDRFPLVFPYRRTEDGFYGLNMHYLPYQLRVGLLDNLMMFRTNNRMDELTRLKYSWAVIDGVSKFAAAQPCVKRYLGDHVRSQFRKVDANDWTTAMLLPVEKFVKLDKQAVWAESRRIMRKR